MLFNKNLYYQNGIYRTPAILDIFSHNTNKMEEKGCLIYKKKRKNLSVIPHSGPYEPVYEPFYAGFKENFDKILKII